MATAKHWEQDKEATVYIGNLDERVTDPLVWELMLQAGRIVNVHLPKDRVTQTHQGYGFVEFQTEEDAEYAAKIMNGIRLYGKPIRVNKASADKSKTVEIGAELFIGNLDAMVDERMIFDTFRRFGSVLSAKIARDDANLSKGFGFVSFDNFESSDAAIEAMNGQYFGSKEIVVQYAFKKDGKGERHGDEAERMLAAQAKKHNVQLPVQPQLFAPPGAQVQPIMNGDGRAQLASPMNMAPGFGPPPPQMPPGFQNGGQMPLGQQPGRPGLSQQNPLPPPPTGLPARPPPSMTGYAPGGYAPPPGFGPAPGYGGPPASPQNYPPGFAPPSQGPPQPGPPPMMPPGFQPNYGNR